MKKQFDQSFASEARAISRAKKLRKFGYGAEIVFEGTPRSRRYFTYRLVQ